MANRLDISDEEWQTIHPILAVHQPVRMASAAACRAVLVAVLWVLRSGAQWRLLPTAQGQWNSVFTRFSRGCRHGVWAALHTGCAHLPDVQHMLIDSPVIRAHPGAAGAAESSAAVAALGRSRAGFGTQIHAITDALGQPLDCVLTGGQASDMGPAETRLGLTPEGAEAFIGDTGYDSDALVQAIAVRGMAAIIPPRSNRTEPRQG
jgi:transposase